MSVAADSLVSDRAPFGVVAIPFVRQPPHARDRMCGAAALAMIYKAWHASSQAGDDHLCRGIWNRVCQADGRGGRFARCHRLAADLCQAAIPAAACQAAKPEQALWAAHRAGLMVIVNFRPSHESPLGHFAVVVKLDRDSIRLHDPQRGPERELPCDEFFHLWRAGEHNSEIAGFGFVAIESPPRFASSHGCEWTAVACPACDRMFPAPQDRSLISAIAGVFCPWCDRGWQLRAR